MTDNLRQFQVKKVKIFNTQDPNFLEAKFYLISEGENRNDSAFTLGSLERVVESGNVFNKPVLAAFSQIKGDFKGHEGILKHDPKTGQDYYDYLGEQYEKPIGVFSESSIVTLENYMDKTWLCATALLWYEYAKEQCDLLKQRKFNKVSVEINVIESTYDDKNFETISSFDFLGVCLLGQDISTGVPNAHLSVLDFSKSEEYLEFRKKFSVALGDKSMELFISKDLIGSKSALKLNKSKDAVSDSAWGDVDKAKLKKDVLQASNYKSLVHSVFMKLEAGWEDGKEGSLGYPVMQKKGEELVYNSGGLSSALGYAKAGGESAIVSKVTSIQKKLGLYKPKEKETVVKMKIKDIKKGYTLLGVYPKFALFCDPEKTYKLPFEEGDKDEKEFDEKKLEEADVVMEGEPGEDDQTNLSEQLAHGMSAYDEKLCKMEEENCKMAADKTELEAKMTKMAEDKVAMEAEKAELESKMAGYEEKKMAVAALEKQLEEAHTEFKALEEELKESKLCKMEGDAQDATDGDDDLDEDDKKEMSLKIKGHEFATFEDFEKALAYKKYQKGKLGKKLIKYNLDNPNPKDTKPLDEFAKARIAVDKISGK